LISGLEKVIAVGRGQFGKLIYRMRQMLVLQFRQAVDPKLKRGALRRAMMGLLDAKSFADGRGKLLFSYGHPLFWAPHTAIGDGGGGP
jgi:hypothetical protein